MCWTISGAAVSYSASAESTSESIAAIRSYIVLVSVQLLFLLNEENDRGGTKRHAYRNINGTTSNSSAASCFSSSVSFNLEVHEQSDDEDMRIRRR